MIDYHKIIDKQIDSNRGTNFFRGEAFNSMQFSSLTLNVIRDFREKNYDLNNELIDYATERAILEFCRINQYYSIDDKARNEIRCLYADLFSNIRNKAVSIDQVSKTHYTNMKSWLQKSNPFAEKLYSKLGKTIDAVTCSEYSVDLQLYILQLNPMQLTEPVLDIGCGSAGIMVKYLRNQGIEAYGFDRLATESKGTSRGDWLTFDYGANKWGTIISHLGFSNHFVHHHHRNDGNFAAYATKYVEILNSLKPGGNFHYAPDLPFMECFLERGNYEIFRNIFGLQGHSSSVIKKLRY
jgi:2-polyprenyl-3-methyl-5-hydroxy-6-metoxy-1,4-benzoquinol methylase